jgi:hypothetical protein
MQSRLTGGLPAKLTQGPRTGYDLSRMGAGAARGANRKKKLEAAPWSGTWPAPGATLDLDFANDRGFVRGLGQGGVMDGITFTRASNGTFVGPDGLLKGGGNALGKNLLTFPQDFDNGAWTKTGSTTVTPNVEKAPNETVTADFLLSRNASSSHGFYQFVGGASVGELYVFSIYVKASNWQWVDVEIGGAGNTPVYFDIQNGVVGNVPSGRTAYIEDAGGGWFRCVVSVASPTSNLIGQVFLTQSNGGSLTFTGDGTSGIFVWGAQLELGSTATEYFPTNINVPRFDWAGTEVVARGNILLFTEDLGNAVWTKDNLTVTSNKLIPSAVSGLHGIFQNVADLTDRTLYVEAKADGYLLLAVGSPLGTGPNVTVNLSDGAVVRTAGGVVSSSVVALDDGWYGISVSISAAFRYEYYLYVANPAGNGDPSSAWTGDGTSGILIRTPQHEAGLTATPYQANGSAVPTNTPLRPAETCNGLLIEEARTNRLLWCRDATDAAWVKTDITAAKDQTGIDGVANAASSLSATAGGGTCIQTITLASGSRTGSVYLKRLTGAGAVQVSLDGSTWSSVDLSADEWRRIVLSGTVTNPVVGVRIAVSGDAVAMDFGQVEDSDRVSTPILTTSATATRAIDSASIAAERVADNILPRFAQEGQFYIDFKNVGRADIALNANVFGFPQTGAADIRLTAFNATQTRFQIGALVNDVSPLFGTILIAQPMTYLQNIRASLSFSVGKREIWMQMQVGNGAINRNMVRTDPMLLLNTSRAITLGQSTAGITVSRVTVRAKPVAPFDSPITLSP